MRTRLPTRGVRKRRNPPSISPPRAAALGLAAALLLAAPGCETRPPPRKDPPPGVRAAETVIAPAPDAKKPPFTFSAEDSAFLETVQHGAFLYLWEHVAPETGMVHDRSSRDVVSIAGVGFQLSAIPIAVERAWITRGEGQARVEKILTALGGRDDNRRFGLFYHYLSGKDASPAPDGYEGVVSTIDSALLFAGVITASSYFGGEIAALAGPILDAADWSAFIAGPGTQLQERGFISLGWKPADPARLQGEGSLLPYYWLDNGDEHRLVTFLAVSMSSGKPGHEVDPKLYYRLRRGLGEYGAGPFAWFPWSGALFTAFFAHCWIDYASMGPDNPAAFGVDQRAKIDWWENSRRIVAMHRAKAAEAATGKPGGPVGWGLSASDAPKGYAVPGLFPRPLALQGAIPERDFPAAPRPDDSSEGTLAPYAAGCAVMFEPEAALAALRGYRDLKTETGSPLIWREPRKPGDFGFLDAFNLEKKWVATDYVAIDEGPLCLSIENSRTGLVWRLFHAHPTIQRGMARLGLQAGR